MVSDPPTGITYVSYHVSDGNNLGPMEGKQALLTTELCLQSHNFPIFKSCVCSFISI